MKVREGTDEIPTCPARCFPFCLSSVVDCLQNALQNRLLNNLGGNVVSSKFHFEASGIAEVSAARICCGTALYHVRSRHLRSYIISFCCVINQRFSHLLWAS